MFRRYRSASASDAELPKARLFFYWLLTAAFFLLVSAVVVLPLVSGFPGTHHQVSTTVTLTLAQSAMAVVGAILFLYAFGRARLERNAWTARQVDVTEFDDQRSAHGGDSVPMSAAELTARFEQKLTDSRIYRTAAVPDAGRVYDVIQIVENAGDAAQGGWWKVASRLIRLVRPPTAFRVTAVILDGGTPGSRKIVIELLRLPRFTSTPLVIEDNDWDRLLERAANSVAALVFPVTKLCRQEQWVAWRNRAMPTELFDAYQRAHQFQVERRYDEALAEFYRALKYDPSNVYVRLEIGQLQERLDLHLEALSTYDDVIVICSRENRSLSRWWNSTDFIVEGRRLVSHRSRALLLARYRHALVLGLGDRIADQWWLPRWECAHDQHWDPRRRQRAYLRATLQHRFDRYRDKIPDDAWQPRDPRARRGFDDIMATEHPSGLDETERRQRADVLRAYLCTLSQYEFERLVKDSRKLSNVRQFASYEVRESVSRCSLRVGLVWSIMRRAMAKFVVDGAVVGAPVDIGGVAEDAVVVPGSVELFQPGKWPPDPTALLAVVDRVLVRRARWHEHYSAACVFAVALLPAVSAARDSVFVVSTDEQRDALARAAIRQLHWAASESHTEFLARRRPWLMYEDPDLDSLRGSPIFRNFEMLIFSPDRPPSLLPRGVKALELVFAQSQLVAAVADFMADVWRSRELSHTVESRTLRSWHALEERAWRQVALLAVGHRDWHTRFRVISELRQWSVEFGGADGNIEFTQYAEDTLRRRDSGFGDPAGEDAVARVAADPGTAEIDRVAAAYIDKCERRMRGLARELYHLAGGHGEAGDCPNSPSVIARMNIASTDLARWIEKRDTADWLWRCRDRAALWESLRDWFDDEATEDSATARYGAFHTALSPGARRWVGAGDTVVSSA